ncbi:MAG: hypothetical protein ABFR35_01280 [Thermodesulfobacteriota bacterium]
MQHIFVTFAEMFVGNTGLIVMLEIMGGLIISSMSIILGKREIRI